MRLVEARRRVARTVGVTESMRGYVPGTVLISQERARQVVREGWTPEHDDEHAKAELATAGVGYAMFAVEQLVLATLDEELPEVAYDRPPAEMEWPWHPDWWKPSTDPVRNLVKAGALIAAEIDRIQRAADSGCTSARA